MNLDWDPEIDTPATIAVIGGGPIGVETALYARFLGYYVILFEQAKIGQSLRNRGQSLMPFPIHEVVSSVGLAALQAQGAAIDFAASAEAMTYAQFSEKYLTPVAKTDLLYESVHVNAKVLSISRVGVPLDSAVSSEERAEKEFRILVNSKARGEFTQLADIVLDFHSGGRTLDFVPFAASDWPLDSSRAPLAASDCPSARSSAPRASSWEPGTSNSFTCCVRVAVPTPSS